MATQSRKSSTASGNAPPDAPNSTVKWSLLGACSHSSAIAVGNRARLAFHKDGLQAYGGYIEGFLPAKFACTAIAADDKILAFLSLSDADVTLKAGKDSTFELRRGDSVIKFTGSDEMPAVHDPVDEVEFIPPTVAMMDALLECVPKTGWGAMNVEMLGCVIDCEGAIATDNTSFAWAPQPNAQLRDDERIILPRPFCMALSAWSKYHKEAPPAVSYNDKAAYALWEGGAKLYGMLPEVPEEKGVNFDSLKDACEAAKHVPLPEGFNALLAEAAIFSEDILLESTGTALQLSTPGPISWHRSIAWSGNEKTARFALPLKRLQTALEYTSALAVDKNGSTVHLANAEKSLYVVIATK